MDNEPKYVLYVTHLSGEKLYITKGGKDKTLYKDEADRYPRAQAKAIIKWFYKEGAKERGKHNTPIMKMEKAYNG